MLAWGPSHMNLKSLVLMNAVGWVERREKKERVGRGGLSDILLMVISDYEEYSLSSIFSSMCN